MYRHCMNFWFRCYYLATQLMRMTTGTRQQRKCQVSWLESFSVFSMVPIGTMTVGNRFQQEHSLRSYTAIPEQATFSFGHIEDLSNNLASSTSLILSSVYFCHLLPWPHLNNAIINKCHSPVLSQPPNWSPCFPLAPLESILNAAVRVIKQSQIIPLLPQTPQQLTSHSENKTRSLQSPPRSYKIQTSLISLISSPTPPRHSLCSNHTDLGVLPTCPASGPLSLLFPLITLLFPKITHFSWVTSTFPAHSI